jgi:hypothetical protein
MTLKITKCHKDNFCKDCKDKECIHAGEIIADCPKWKCDNHFKCEECNFIKEYYTSLKKEKNNVSY